MKSDNLNHEEKILVLGAGQLGAAVLDALVPAVIQRQGAVSVIVSPAAWDEAGQLRSGKPPGAGRRRGHLSRRRHCR